MSLLLTPGARNAMAETGHEASKFWNAFFNPTYWPSLLLRTCVCASLAGIWALITASRIDGDKHPELKTSKVQWSVKWLVPSFVAMPFLMIWYYAMVPASQRALLTLGIDTINSGTFSTVTRMALIIIVTSATIIWVAYFLAYRNPRDFNLAHAIAVLVLALMATGAGEYSREMLRKPYVIGCWMYSNGNNILATPYQLVQNGDTVTGQHEILRVRGDQLNAPKEWDNLTCEAVQVTSRLRQLTYRDSLGAVCYTLYKETDPSTQRV